MAQFEYALGPSDTIVNIRDLDEARRRDTFTCPDCRSRLIPNLKDDRKERHFRHEAGVDCSGETEIHWRLKHAFADAFRFAYSHGLSFDAEIEQKHTCVDGCCSGRSDWVRHDLTVYDDARVERRLSYEGKAFIPDCCLTDSTGEHPPLFFEVRVTSKNSDAKIASGHRILEMIVRPKDAHSPKDGEEECLGAIKGRSLSHGLTEWHNFELPALRNGGCPKRRVAQASPAPAPRRATEYSFTGVSLSPPQVYCGDGADGRHLVVLTWFPWNGARVLWDVDARHYLVIQEGVDHGVFPGHRLAYEFCQAQSGQRRDGVGEEF